MMEKHLPEIFSPNIEILGGQIWPVEGHWHHPVPPDVIGDWQLGEWENDKFF
jgi:hypothetical protein